MFKTLFCIHTTHSLTVWLFIQHQSTCRMFHHGATCNAVIKRRAERTTEISGITEYIWLMTYTVNHNTTSFERKATILKSVNSVTRTWPHTLIHVRTNVLICQTSWKEPSGMTNPPDSGLLWCPCMPYPRPGEGSRVDADAYHTRSTKMWRKFLNEVEESRSIRATTQWQSGPETIACTSWDWWNMEMSHNKTHCFSNVAAHGDTLSGYFLFLLHVTVLLRCCGNHSIILVAEMNHQ